MPPPPGLLLPGLFLIAGFISLAIGTSMGTLAAVVPIASDATGRAVPHTGTGPILGYAMSKVTAAGQIVEVALA